MQDNFDKEPQPDWPVFLAAVPLFVIFVVMAISLVRAIREDEAETAAH